MAAQAAGRRTWSVEVISCLIDSVRQSGHLATLMASTSTPNHDAWVAVRQAMGNEGDHRSIPQLRAKWKALKGAFHRERDHRRRHHNRPSQQCPPLYDRLHRLWVQAGRPVFGCRLRTDAMRIAGDARASARAGAAATTTTTTTTTQEEASGSSGASVEEVAVTAQPQEEEAAASRKRGHRRQPLRVAARRASRILSSSSSSSSSSRSRSHRGARGASHSSRHRSRSPLKARRRPALAQARRMLRSDSPGEGPAPRQLEHPVAASERDSTPPPETNEQASLASVLVASAAGQATSPLQGAPSTRQASTEDEDALHVDLGRESEVEAQVASEAQVVEEAQETEAVQVLEEEALVASEAQVVEDAQETEVVQVSSEEAQELEVVQVSLEEAQEEEQEQEPMEHGSLPMPASSGATQTAMLQEILEVLQQVQRGQHQVLEVQQRGQEEGLQQILRSQQDLLRIQQQQLDCLAAIRDSMGQLTANLAALMDRPDRGPGPSNTMEVRATVASPQADLAGLQALLAAMLGRLGGPGTSQ